MTTLSSLFVPTVVPTADIESITGDATQGADANGKTYRFTGAVAQDYALQDQATTGLPVGARTEFLVGDITGAKTVTAPSGVSLNEVVGGSETLSAVIGAGAVLIQVAVDEWYLSGGLQE